PRFKYFSEAGEDAYQSFLGVPLIDRGVWEMGVEGRMGLPQHIDRVSLLIRDSDQAEGQLYAVVTPNPLQGSFDAEVVDAKGTRYLQLSGYRTVAVPSAVDAGRLEALRAAMSLETVAA
ncbi:MAG: hypothetical protein ACLQPN_00565, partial [Bryobacteraceae bacterium]